MTDKKPDPQIKTLADFKRFLAEPGAVVTMLRHDTVDLKIAAGTATDRQKHMYGPRKVIKVQSKSVQFEGPNGTEGFWMDVDKASEWRFDGTNKVILALTDSNTAEYLLSYE